MWLHATFGTGHFGFFTPAASEPQMQILALFKTIPTAAPAVLGPLVKPEAEMVWAMHLTGAVRTAHFLQVPHAAHPTRVALMLEVESLSQAQALMDQLPLVAEGLISVELLSLARFTAYAALFANAPVWGWPR